MGMSPHVVPSGGPASPNKPPTRLPLRRNPYVVAAIIAAFSSLIITLILVYEPFLPSPSGGEPITTSNVISTTVISNGSCFHRYVATGKQATLTVTNLVIPENCLLVLDSYSGTLNGTSWDAGGVLVFRSGIYNGVITDGEYDIVASTAAKHFYCFRVSYITSHNYALSYQLPLPGWGSCAPSDAVL